MEEFKDLYAVLGVAPIAPQEVIRAAYRAMARLHHPDVNKASDESTRMAYINKAYAVLSCPQSRREYDRSLTLNRQIESRRVNKRFDYPAVVLTTYDHRGRLHAYA